MALGLCDRRCESACRLRHGASDQVPPPGWMVRAGSQPRVPVEKGVPIDQRENLLQPVSSAKERVEARVGSLAGICAGLGPVAGTLIGDFIYMLAAIGGLAAAIHASPFLFQVLQ